MRNFELKHNDETVVETDDEVIALTSWVKYVEKIAEGNKEKNSVQLLCHRENQFVKVEYTSGKIIEEEKK